MIADARILLHMVRGMPAGASHAERLQRFYAGQADHYDQFRERLLRGRREMLDLLDVGSGEQIVELGGGTGRNLEFLGSRIETLDRVDLVDICPSLLQQARQRLASHVNVRVIEADACEWRPEAPVDAVYMSYALSMIPDWRRAMDNAIAMLKPGGRLGIVDFTLPPAHATLTRGFWRAWFGHDGVRPDDAHLARLQELLPEHRMSRETTRLPYLPGPRAHYYIFLGRKR